MSAKKRSNFLVQGSILAAASLLVRLIGLLYRIPMTNIIGNEGMGYYTYAFDIYNIALILSSYSLPLAVSKLIASRGINKEYRNAYRIFKCAMSFAIIAGFSSMMIIFFGADFFAKLISNNPNVALPLRVLSPTIFVFAVMGVLRGFYQGKNTMIPTAVSQVLEQIINAAVSIIASYILVKNFNKPAYGAAGGTLGTFAGAFVSLLFLLFVFAVYKPVLKKQIRNDKSHTRESYGDIMKLLFATIFPIILSQTVYQISGLIDGSLFGHIMVSNKVTSFDHIFLQVKTGIYYTKESISSLKGVYGSKYLLLTNVPVAIAAAMGSAIVTSITASKARGMDDAIRLKIHSSIKLNMIIAIPSAIGMTALAAPIMQLIFNDSSRLSANMLTLGALSIVFYALSTVSSAVLQGINKLQIPVRNSAISLGIHIVLVFVMLKYTPLSTYALVIGNVTFAMTVSILNWISIGKYMNYKQEIKKTFLVPSISSVFMGAAAYFSYKGLCLLTGTSRLSTVIAILIAVIVYFFILLLLKGIEVEEFQSLPKGRTIVRLLRKLHLI